MINKFFAKLLLSILILTTTNAMAAVFIAAHSTSQPPQQPQIIVANNAMRCDLYENTENGLFYCKELKWNRKNMSIQDYFDTYKPNNSCKLSGISVDHYHNEIFIYFNC
jgi:hypothetical protein